MDSTPTVVPVPGPALVVDCAWCGGPVEVDPAGGSISCPACDVVTALVDEASEPQLATAA